MTWFGTLTWVASAGMVSLTMAPAPAVVAAPTSPAASNGSLASLGASGRALATRSNASRPTITRVTAQSAAVALRWTSAGRTYRVQGKVVGHGWWVAVGSTTTRRATIGGLDPGTRYRFRVAVKHGKSWAYGGRSASVRPLTPVAPPTPTPAPPTPTPTPGPTPGPPTDWTPPVVPSGTTIWVSGASGSDANPGTEARPVATITEAWNRIPSSTTLSTSVRILVRAGTYADTTSPGYWENRWGTASAPITLEAIDGAHTVRLLGDMNVFNVRHLWVSGIDIIRSGDAFHCERCSYLTISDVHFDGGGAAQETIKVNQSDHIDIVSSDIASAYDNAIDYVAVQHSLISGNRIHDAQGWCAYVKGGSAYITFSVNDVYGCGEGGFTAGQGTGFEFMVAPWLRYEAYGVTVTDNIIHDVWGAGLGVNGSYNVVMAFNTLYRIGTRSHAVEFVHGARGCDGNTGQCATNLAAGGWGALDGGGQWIPSKHVYFLNNLVYNPTGVETAWQHFTVADPVTAPLDSGVPNPSLADDDLQIHGNVISNGGPDMNTGLADPAKSANLLATNWVNVMVPALRNPAAGDFRPTIGGNIDRLTSLPIPTLSWADVGLAVPAGGSPAIATDRPPGALR